MNGEAHIQSLEKRVLNLISTDPDIFLVDIRIKPVNNIKIFVDGDQGVSIDRLVQFNRRLYKQLEEENLYPDGDFSLEFSSPGLEEPLKFHRQYLKNVGRFIEITDVEGLKKEGKLTGVTETAVEVEITTGKGKKAEVKQEIIPLETIKTAKIQIKF